MANLELFIQVMIALIIIIIMAQLFGRLIKLIGQPSVVGEMISGVVLGPTVFGYFLPEASGFIFPKEIMSSLFIISNLGLSIYMFLVGAELNMSLFNKKTFHDATALSTAAIIVPFIIVFLVSDGNTPPIQLVPVQVDAPPTHDVNGTISILLFKLL